MFVNFGNINPIHDLSVTVGSVNLRSRTTEIYERMGNFDIFLSHAMMACQEMNTSVAVL